MSYSLEQSEAFLKHFLEEYPIRHDETLEEIKKFVGVGEVEIAFESAMLCHFEQMTTFPESEKQLIVEHAKSFKLDEETMYIDDFFDRLLSFLS